MDLPQKKDDGLKNFDALKTIMEQMSRVFVKIFMPMTDSVLEVFIDKPLFKWLIFRGNVIFEIIKDVELLKMQFSMFWIRWLVGILLLPLLLPPNSSIASEPVKIGIIFARTGNAAPVCKAAFKAVRLAADKLNQAGGLLNHPVQLIEYDNKSTPIGARHAAQNAVKDRVIGVIGATYSSHSIAMSKVLQPGQVPMISPISTHPELTIGKDYIFRVCFTDDFQGRVMADFALHDLGALSSAVFTNTSSKYSMGLASVFIDRFVNQGGQVMFEGEYQNDTIEFAFLLDRIKDHPPGIVYIPGHYRESAYIIKQARLMGLSIVFLGGDGWVNQMYTYGGSYIHGNYYTTQWHYDSPNPRSRRFVAEFKKKYGSVTNEPVMALTYDAFMVLADAVKRAGTFSRTDIRAELARTNGFKGVTGKITFDQNGDPVDKSAMVLKFDDYDSSFYKILSP
ncbi:MAG: hypothetical protein D3926_17205 [Desulfobacteraceae bacterium]|nr:MAG: hypothetical protein D3926_17205 [Desulfobacteraceae bacterium]